MRKYLVLPFVIFAATTSFAGSSKVLNLPFNDEPLMSNNHDGIYFKYNLETIPMQEIVCELKNGYKATIEYREHGQLVNSGASDRFILTSKGADSSGDSEDSSKKNVQKHVDATGAVRLTDFNHGKIPTLSCHYEFDDNPLKG